MRLHLGGKRSGVVISNSLLQLVRDVGVLRGEFSESSRDLIANYVVLRVEFQKSRVMLGAGGQVKIIICSSV